VMNGAKVGAGCLIGAGALITEGKDMPEGALVMGAPGKVVRMLDAAGRARLLTSAEHYRANAARFAAGLQAIS
jgi:carbonic anhydrase/acetyltransferase-like protein (isoleucine patch superfamily)